MPKITVTLTGDSLEEVAEQLLTTGQALQEGLEAAGGVQAHGQPGAQQQQRQAHEEEPEDEREEEETPPARRGTAPQPGVTRGAEAPKAGRNIPPVAAHRRPK